MDENSRLSRLAVAGLSLSGVALAMTGVLAILAGHGAIGGFGGSIVMAFFRAMLEVGIGAVSLTVIGLAGASLWRYQSGRYTRSSRVVAALALFVALALLVGLAIGKRSGGKAAATHRLPDLTGKA